ncbi:unnamed protein product [Brassicogethes aeneus]|uniref:Phospholipid scramblase n=1 Tax=Brassicogethes aeneus TaxID=1431903 RepID=A0A9P0BG21_BRAAE|nr:unnamed protein product [Brassicogethes aeneus]
MRNTFTMEDIRLLLFSDENASIINRQPARDDDGFPGSRRPIPISFIDLETSQTSCFTPLHGLDFLRPHSQYVIQQTVELQDLLDEASENRFNIKAARGETLYSASESSTGCQRSCFGSSRSYIMKVFDPSQQKVMEFRRRLACGACNFWFYLQELEVWADPGEYLGAVKQNMALLKTSFNVSDRNANIIYNIQGPDSFCCLLGKNENFHIYNKDGSTQVGTIIHQWDQLENSYNIQLQTPDNATTRHKALLLGAAFLLEYMYFENTKKTRVRCIC